MKTADHRRIAIVTPLFNDWDCLPPLVRGIGAVATAGTTFSIFVIDDCSTAEVPAEALQLPPAIDSVEIVRLRCNVGHQRAIAIGLCLIAERPEFEAVIVMDADGEDQPGDIPELLLAHAAEPLAVIAAQRQRRSEPMQFRLMYRAFKSLFRALTGRTIDFGNYCLIPQAQLGRIVHMRELWTHLGATLLKSRIRIVKVPTVRGRRFHGSSTMSVPSLIIHGFSAISVFIDSVFVRLIILCACLVVAAAVIGLGATFIRLATSTAIPGWATSVVGFAVVLMFQAVTLLTVSAIMMLANRSAMPVFPTREGLRLIQDSRVIATGAEEE